MVKKWLINIGTIVAIIYLFLPITTFSEYSEDIFSTCICILMCVSYGFFLFVALEKMDNKQNNEFTKNDNIFNNDISNITIKKNNEGDNEISNLEECLIIAKQTLANAKKDLSTGISESDLENLHNSNLISDEDYVKTKAAIESLKMIVETYPQTIKSLQKQISEHNSTKN